MSKPIRTFNNRRRRAHKKSGALIPALVFDDDYRLIAIKDYQFPYPDDELLEHDEDDDWS